ncbi:hypothetical protein Y032_0139g2102 [Ancylostoma ceylanicum]|uniref:Methyltransferase domain-containing protein n=2 Tax=Ancylostoma ceylanicum TaxID=53326 RepID=A0A016T4D5_9BILA|nr:hypothetical protein Y032_0139g2102 [Ancylostoma ceylanicum]
MIQVQCPVLVRVGSIVDGGKFVCNPNAISEKKCRIYSLGINDEISFDQEIQNITKNRCRIYGYDDREQQKGTKESYKRINGKLGVIHISNEEGHRIGSFPMTQPRILVISLLLLAAVAVLYLGGLKSAGLEPIYTSIAQLNGVVKNLTQIEEIRNAWMRDYYTKQALERVKQLQRIGYSSGYEILYNVIVPEVQCPVLVRVGSIVDGGKFVCNPSAISQKNCRIYSLGIAGEISFDREIQKITENRCRIYGYDSMEQQEETKKNYEKINGKLGVIHISTHKGHRIGNSLLR